MRQHMREHTEEGCILERAGGLRILELAEELHMLVLVVELHMQVLVAELRKTALGLEVNKPELLEEDGRVGGLEVVAVEGRLA